MQMQMQTPLEADPPDAEPLGYVTCDACWEGNRPPPNRQTNTCENITLPQTSFVGGNNIRYWKFHRVARYDGGREHSHPGARDGSGARALALAHARGKFLHPLHL